ncbi:MAG: hypothetical protein KC506_02385 [Nanoarchaeota archaeon]|nr:hypothetical protein [Nanoarchaeota archaeon]
MSNLYEDMEREEEDLLGLISESIADLRTFVHDDYEGVIIAESAELLRKAMKFNQDHLRYQVGFGDFEGYLTLLREYAENLINDVECISAHRWGLG